jgi:hypothetical protein
MIAGGVLTGIGVGVLIVSEPLQGTDPNVIGGAFVLSDAPIGCQAVASHSR